METRGKRVAVGEVFQKAILGRAGRAAATGLLLWGALLCPVAADPIPTDPQAPSNLEEADRNIPEVKDAIEKFTKGDAAGCIKSLEEAVTKNPDLPPAKLMLSRLLFQAQQGPNGRIMLEQSAKENPAHPAPYLLIGDIAYSEGRILEAGFVYSKAKEVAAVYSGKEETKNQYLSATYSGVAAVAEAKQEWEAAAKELEAWLKLDPKAHVARQRYGRVMFQLGKTNEAYAEFQTNADQSDKVEPPGVMMGRLFEIAGDRAKAQQWMDFAIKDKKWGADVRTKAGVARWYFDTDRPADARKLLNDAINLKPEEMGIKLLMGVVLRFLKQYPEAEKMFEEVYNKAPNDASAANQLVLCLVEQDDKTKQKRALDLAEINARLNAKSPEVQATLGYVYYVLGRKDDARRRLSGAAEMTGGRANPDLLFYGAQMQFDEGRLDAAKQMLDIALQTKTPYAYRNEAQKMLDEINAKLGTAAVPPAGGPPAAVPPVADAPKAKP